MSEDAPSPSKKKKATKVPHRNREKRIRYRDNRPDFVRNLVSVARSCGIEKAEEYRNGTLFKSKKPKRQQRTNGITGKAVALRKVLEEEKLRSDLRKERKLTRKADPIVQKRLTKKRVSFLKDRAAALSQLIEIKRKEVIIDSVTVVQKEGSTEEYVTPSESSADLEDLYKMRKSVRRKLAHAEQRLA